MKTSKCTEEQIAYALRQVEGGTAVSAFCRRLGISEQTFYRWKAKLGQMGVSELRKMRQFEEENRKLKQLVADLSLDKHMLQEEVQKSSKARAGARAGRVFDGRFRCQHPPCLPGTTL